MHFNLLCRLFLTEKKKGKPTNQIIIYGKELKSHLEMKRKKIMLKCVFLKNIQPIRRAFVPTGKYVLLNLPEKAIKKMSCI